MNVALGGSLVNDLTRDTGVSHWQDHLWADEVHDVEVAKDSQLASTLGHLVRVNSIHHQAVDRPAPGMRQFAMAADGTPEGFEDPNRRFFIGVQWHPEFLLDRSPAHQALFNQLIVAAKEA